MKKFLIAAILCSAPLCGEEKKGLISLGAGLFNITKSQDQFLFEAEYKWRPICLDLRVLTGFFITQEKATYIYGAISYDLHVPYRLILTPSFGPGIYFQGAGKNLGFPLEFRSCLELAFRFLSENRIGLKFYHISNASLGTRNPGSNNLVLFFAF